MLLVDHDAPLFGDQLRVDNSHVRGRHRGDEALDQRGKQRLCVRQGREGALVSEVEGRAGFQAAGLALLGREILCVQGAHLFHEADKGLESLELFGEDERSIDGAAREITSEDGGDLLTHIDGDIFLRFDGRCTQVRSGDCSWMCNEFGSRGVRFRWFGGEDVDASAGNVA